LPSITGKPKFPWARLGRRDVWFFAFCVSTNEILLAVTGCWGPGNFSFYFNRHLMLWILKLLPSHSNIFSAFPTPSATLLDLTGLIVRVDDYPSAHGGSADVWKGIWPNKTGKCEVHLEFIVFGFIPT
jgi:hypothetical protein